ncbi:MAG: response regulator [Dehalococcoidia bacterium]
MARRRIQVVVGDVIVADEISRTLQDLGHEVTAVVNSGEEAVNRAQEDIPDLILMDTTLQGNMDGLDAASQIRSRSFTPIVYLTPHVDSLFMERAQQTAPYGFILKPVAEDELESSVQMALGAPPPGDHECA